MKRTRFLRAVGSGLVLAAITLCAAREILGFDTASLHGGRWRDGLLLVAGLALCGAARRHGPAPWLALAVAALGPPGCELQPPAPEPGRSDVTAPGEVAVPGGRVNAVGGNLVLVRDDLSIDTRLGTFELRHVYNGATAAWRWSFETTYAGGVFVDPTGARYDVAARPPGPIAGTDWTKRDDRTLETRGGLVHEFASDGRLLRVRWRSAPYPALELRATDGRVTAIEQCTAATRCTPVFMLAWRGGELASVTDRAGRRTDYAWTDGRLSAARDGFAVARGLPGYRYAYTAGRLSSVRSAEGEEIRFESDAAGRLVRATAVGEESPSWRFSYESGRTRVVDPTGRETIYEFDALRHVTAVRFVEVGERWAFGWGGARIVRTTGPDGLETLATWKDDALETLRTPDGNLLRIQRAANGENRGQPFEDAVLEASDAAGLVIRRGYDAQGRLVQETNGAGETTTFVWNAAEELAEVRRPDGTAIRLAEYGEHGRPARIALGALEETRTYDAVGNLERGSDADFDTGTGLGGVRRRCFDEHRLVERLVLLDTDLVIERRSDGRPAAIRRPYGADAEFVYDAIGRLAEKRERVDGAFVATRFGWSPRGELVWRLRPNGMEEEFLHDALGREILRTSRRDGVLEGELRTVIAAGRVVRREDRARPRPEVFSYDAAGRLASVTWSGGESTQFGYDARGAKASVLYRAPNGATLREIRLVHDGAGRETEVWDGAMLLVRREFDRGRLARILTGNGIVRDVAYDESGLPAGTTSRDAEGSVIERTTRTGLPHKNATRGGLSFPYAGVSGTVSGSFGTEAISERMVWIPFGPEDETAGMPDGAVLETLPEPAGTPNGFTAMQYDDLVNLRSRLSTRPGSLQRDWFVANAEHNRLLEIRRTSDDVLPGTRLHRYAYDPAGFATARDGVPLEWTATGHARRIGDATFERDARGRTISSTVLGVTRRWLFGGDVEADAGGTPIALDLGVVRIDLRSGAKRWRHADWRGNAQLVSDDSGRFVTLRTYSAFRRERRVGDTEDALGFAQGQELAGLVLIGDRVYDEDAWRFLSPDPLPQTIQQTWYAAQRPIELSDTTGGQTTAATGYDIATAVGGAIGAGAGATIGALIGGPVLGVPLAWAGAGLGGYLGSKIGGGAYLFFYQAVTGERAPREVESLFGPACCDAGGTVTPASFAPSSGLAQLVARAVPPGAIDDRPPGFEPAMDALPGGFGSGVGGPAGPSGGYGAAGSCGLLGIEPALAAALARALRRAAWRRAQLARASRRVASS